MKSTQELTSKPLEPKEPEPKRDLGSTGEGAGKLRKDIAFPRFWEIRNIHSKVFLDWVTTNNISVLVAFAAYKLGLSANHLSLINGIFGLLNFGAALVLPADQAGLPVVILFILSQMAYLFDCADGQLARSTNTESRFGHFVDMGMDIAINFLCFGSFFIYAYRFFSQNNLIQEANLALIVGFMFLGARTSRFFVLQMFSWVFPETYKSTKSKVSKINMFLLSIMDHQFSVLNMLVFLVSPLACLAVFAAQALMLAATYARYFLRASSV